MPILLDVVFTSCELEVHTPAVKLSQEKRNWGTVLKMEPFALTGLLYRNHSDGFWLVF
ncbi:hypothetical protein [Nostoc sp. 2RC]|uniref:hypothetical protein n=1 Tax=Nostoc sp. 2RC TaxID=2485484 RepID=UPI001626C9D5|nr:hypothetical protein [Nostoc sp. 2RC]MBC1237218.1 hypothetical protein [Nostoc sp. 2RC]